LAESSEDVNTKLTDNFHARQTIYLRLPFEVEDPSTLRELELSVDHEGGGLIAYLNGELVARNLIGGSSTWDMRAWAPLLGQSSRFTVDITEAIRHLRTGTNVLALHGAQYDSNGLTIVPRLRVGIANPKLVVESPKPIESRLPSGQRLVLKATGLGPNAETPVNWWVAASPPGGSVQFSEQVNGTLADFSAPGKYELLATAYHPAQPQSARRVVYVGEAANDVPSGAVVEAGEALPLTGLLGRLDGRVDTANLDYVEWSQDDGPGTVVIQEPNR
jgi:hypothetical protein